MVFLSFQDNGLARILKDDKTGFIDKSGKIVIPLIYTNALIFDHQNLARVKLNNRHGFLHANGSIVIPLQWDYAAPFDDVSAPVRSGIEIIDQDGKSQSPPEEEANPNIEKEGLARVEKNGKWGCIDRRGELIVDPEWDSLSEFDDKGLAKISRSGKHGLINRKGEIIIPPEWDQELVFDDRQLAVAQLGKKYGFIDITGKIGLPIEWDLLDDLAATWNPKSDDVAVLDLLRRLSRPARFDSKSMAIVQRNKKYGFINRSGKIVIPLIWDEIYPFDDDDMALVKCNGKFGFINRAGEIVLALEWDDVGGFDGSVKCHVTKNTKSGYINRTGDTIVPVEWDRVNTVRGSNGPGLTLIGNDDPLAPDVLEATKDKKHGYIDWTGKVLVAPEWTHLLIRTDAGAEQCCFVVSRSVADDAQPGWMKSARDWLLGLIGRAEQRNVVCHLYATDGALLWSSDWLSSTFWALAIAAIAGLVMAWDGIAIWRKRRRERIAAMAPSAPRK